jgi:hypothetical protein
LDGFVEGGFEGSVSYRNDLFVQSLIRDWITYNFDSKCGVKGAIALGIGVFLIGVVVSVVEVDFFVVVVVVVSVVVSVVGVAVEVAVEVVVGDIDGIEDQIGGEMNNNRLDYTG